MGRFLTALRLGMIALTIAATGLAKAQEQPQRPGSEGGSIGGELPRAPAAHSRRPLGHVAARPATESVEDAPRSTARPRAIERRSRPLRHALAARPEGEPPAALAPLTRQPAAEQPSAAPAPSSRAAGLGSTQRAAYCAQRYQSDYYSGWVRNKCAHAPYGNRFEYLVPAWNCLCLGSNG